MKKLLRKFRIIQTIQGAFTYKGDQIKIQGVITRFIFDENHNLLKKKVLVNTITNDSFFQYF